MSRADKPTSSQKVSVGVGGNPQFSFNPIIDKLVSAVNKCWTQLFFTPNYTRADLDDDKLPNTSQKWRMYDQRTKLSQDKKLKPVINVIVNVVLGFIMWIRPKKLSTKNHEMLKNAILFMTFFGNTSTRGAFVLFMDHGYIGITTIRITKRFPI